MSRSRRSDRMNTVICDDLAEVVASWTMMPSKETDTTLKSNLFQVSEM